MNLSHYKKLIDNAQTKCELSKIVCDAFLDDNNALSGKKSLYNKVVELCIKREAVLDYYEDQ